MAKQLLNVSVLCYKKFLSSSNWYISFLHNQVPLATDTVLIDAMDEDPLSQQISSYVLFRR